MTKMKKFHAGGAAVGGFQERAASAMRPAMEAALVAAMAFGCAQVGWSVLTPLTAGASSEDAAGREPLQIPGGPPSATSIAAVVSPFALDDAAVDGGSHAINAIVSNLQLTGVRVSTDATRSSAILTMADGAQRAFRVGQEIADGVQLADVAGSSAILSYPGGQRRLEISAPAVSFARALMGEAPAPTPASAPALTAAAPAKVTALALTPADLTPFSIVEPTPVSAVVLSAPAPIEPIPVTAVAGPTPVASGAPLFAIALRDAAPGDVSPMDAAGARSWFARLVADRLADPGATTAGWRLPAALPSMVSGLGLQPGDVIVAVNGADASQTAAAMAAAASSERLELTVARGDQRLTIVTAAPVAEVAP